MRDIEGVTPGAFWAEGSVVGLEISVFKYQDDEQQPSVVIQAGAAEVSAGEYFHTYQGTIVSNHAGRPVLPYESTRSLRKCI